MAGLMEKDLLKLPLSRQIALAALVSLVVHGTALFLQWYAVSPIGHGGYGFIWFIPLFFLPALGIAPAVPVSLFLLPFRRSRRHGVTMLSCGLVYVLIGVGVFLLLIPVRRYGFRLLSLRSHPLIEAIHDFTKTRGRPPENLDELVPDYLPKVPGTGMPAYPKYEYSTDRERWKGNPWVLYVNCPSGGINFDTFIYFPDHNYPKSGFGGILEPVGDWAYVHE